MGKKRTCCHAEAKFQRFPLDEELFVALLTINHNEHSPCLLVILFWGLVYFACHLLFFFFISFQPSLSVFTMPCVVLWAELFFYWVRSRMCTLHQVEMEMENWGAAEKVKGLDAQARFLFIHKEILMVHERSDHGDSMEMHVPSNLKNTPCPSH